MIKQLSGFFQLHEEGVAALPNQHSEVSSASCSCGRDDRKSFGSANRLSSINYFYELSLSLQVSNICILPLMRKEDWLSNCLELKVSKHLVILSDLQYPCATFHCRKDLNVRKGLSKDTVIQTEVQHLKKEEKLTGFENKGMQSALHRSLRFCQQTGSAKACNRLHKVLYIQAQLSQCKKHCRSAWFFSFLTSGSILTLPFPAMS